MVDSGRGPESSTPSGIRGGDTCLAPDSPVRGQDGKQSASAFGPLTIPACSGRFRHLFRKQPRPCGITLDSGAPLLDSRGRIRCISADHRLVRWDGHQWSKLPFPENVLDGMKIQFIPDDRDQAWLLPSENQHRTAVLDLQTGEMARFPKLFEALEAQLPRG